MPDLTGLLPATPALRLFAVANLVNTIGTGLFVTAGTLYFTRVVGLGLNEVGIGLSVTIGLALLAMVPLGRLADRVGAKHVYTALLLLQSAAMVGYLFVEEYVAFLVVAAFSAVADRGINATVGALIHDVTEGSDRVAARAYLRSITNIGFAVGSSLAGLALTIGTPTAFRAVVAGNALMFLAAALLVLRMPSRSTPPIRTAAARVDRRSAIKDRPYVLVSCANAALTLHFELLSFALPLWVVLRTDAPPWIVSLVFVANTAMIVLFQVRVSRRMSSVPTAAAGLRLVGVLLLGSCVIMAVTAHSSGVATVVALLVWAGIYTVAELLHASAEFTMSFDLADDRAQGDYQSVFALARSVVRAVAPALLSVVVLHPSGWGWVGAGAVLAVATVLTRRAALAAHSVVTAQPGARAVEQHAGAG